MKWCGYFISFHILKLLKLVNVLVSNSQHLLNLNHSGMALSIFSINLAVDCCIKFLSLVARDVIVDSSIHHCLPTLQVPRFNTFSFMPSICCKAFIVKNLSLHSRLFTLGILKSFVVIHPVKTSNFTCKMSLYSLFHQYFLSSWIPY